MNILQQIPASARRWVYLGFALVGLVLGALQVAYASADAGQPVWLGVAFDVLGYLGIALGVTAGVNVSDSRTVAVTAPEGSPTTVTTRTDLPHQP